jgi:RNA polymerase sigma-70 factor (ECF subfamily)
MEAFANEVAGQMRMLRHFALKLCRDTFEADDLVQETCAKALARQHQFSPGSNIEAWLTTILRNHFYDARKRRKRWETENPDGQIGEDIQAYDDQEAALVAKDALLHLADLPAPMHRALLMSAHGASINDMAKLEGVAAGTIKSRVSRARVAFAEILGDREMLA